MNKINLSLFLFLIIGIFYLILIPPFESPDEIAHLARGYAIAEGQFILKNHPDFLIQFMETIHENQHGKEFPALVKALEQTKEDRVPNIAFNTSLYSPAPYLLQALGTEAWRLSGNKNPMILFYLLRIISLTTYLGLIWIAVKIFPEGAWPLLWVAITPMALSQACAVSTDAVIFGSAALLYAGSFGTLKTVNYTIVTGCSIFFLMASKLPFLPLLLIPVAAAYLKKNQLHTRILLITIVISIAIAFYWNTLLTKAGIFDNSIEILKTYFNLQLNLNPVTQLISIFQQPIKFCLIFFNTFFDNSITLAHRFVGVLGHLNLPIPFSMVILWGIGSTAVVAMAKQPAEVTGKKALILGITCLIAALLTVVAIFTSGFLLWTPVGAESVNLQGRYFHPVAVALFLGMVLIRPRPIPAAFHPTIKSSLLLAGVMINFAAIYAVIQKYGIWFI